MRKKLNRKFKCFLQSVVLLVVCGFFLNNIFNMVKEMQVKDREAKVLEKQLKELKDDEERLAMDVEKLKDPDYVAVYLREKYLYSSDGEIIIRIPEENEKS